MKSIIGILLIVLGVAVGLYVGVYLMFIGGIAGLINVIVHGVKTGMIEGWPIALNIGKIMFSTLVGYLSAIVLVIPGAAMLD
jgi:hypothetical protein